MHKAAQLMVLAILTSICGMGQVDSLKIKVQGTVLPPLGSSGLLNLMVVNQTTSQGLFGDPSGEFTIIIGRNDSLMVASTGFKTKKISFRDSVYRPIYDVLIRLEVLAYDLRQVEIFPKRDLEKIYKDIDKLGYQKKEYIVSGIDAFNSPITFLYQSFSRRERQKRLAAQLINEDKRRDLLKELLTQYVHADIIQLENGKFDEFIDFCNVSDSFMKNTSQYDFIMFIKKRYAQYMDTYGW